MGCSSSKVQGGHAGPRGTNDYDVHRLLGEGGFAQVYEGALAWNPAQRVAIKVLPKSKMTTPKHVQTVLGEVQLLQRLRHPLLTQLQHAFQDDCRAYMACDLCRCDMYTLLSKTPMARLTEEQVKFVACNVLLCFSYLHPRGVVHRDIKPGAWRRRGAETDTRLTHAAHAVCLPPQRTS